MKSKTVLLFSLLINASLAIAVIWLVTHRPAPAAPENPAAAESPASPALPGKAPDKTPPSDTAVVTNRIMQAFDWRMVESADYRKYIANLREIGCPEETIRDIIVADVNKLFDARRREITASTNKFEFWKAGNPFADVMNPDRIEKLQELAKEKRALLIELLGTAPDEKPEMMAGFNPFESMLDFLPTAKQTEIMDVYMKYQAKMAKGFSGGAPDAEDMKQMQKMQKEMETELAGMLTPQEYEDYQLRMSQTAMMMRMQLASFEPNEQEFREIFNLKKAFDDEHGGMFGAAAMNKEERDKRKAAETELNGQLKNLLGEARYAEYERAQDWAYQGIYRLTERHNLPKESAVKVYDMKKIAEEQARKVRQDQSLTKEQREAALQGIRGETERSIQTVLGDKAWTSYQSQPGNYWLRGISPDPKTD